VPISLQGLGSTSLHFSQKRFLVHPIAFSVPDLREPEDLVIVLLRFKQRAVIGRQGNGFRGNKRCGRAGSVGKESATCAIVGSAWAIGFSIL
jgi:hypothetical protein